MNQLSLYHRVLGKVSRLIPMSWKSALYNFPLIARILQKTLTAHATDEPVVVTVEGGVLKGWKLRLSLASNKGCWLGTYEPIFSKAIESLVKPEMVVYDVGGYIGYFTMVFARLVGNKGKVYVFDPLPSNIATIQEQVRLNQVEHVAIHSVAVSDKVGTAEFSRHASASMGQLKTMDERFEESFEVKIISLDEFVFSHGNPSPDLVKMDIEGAEVMAIPGMRRLLETAKPSILMEIHGDAGRTVWSVLKANGYRGICLDDGRDVETMDEINYGHYLFSCPSKNN